MLLKGGFELLVEVKPTSRAEVSGLHGSGKGGASDETCPTNQTERDMGVS